jgi:squalene-hopene/tetraprenyl-beta-curcumene cyclase
MTLTTDADAHRTLSRATGRLIALQSTEGWWKGELETNVTMDAEDLLLREFLRVRTEEQTARSAAWIRSRQRADGTWATFHDGPPDLSTTVEAYLALRLAGDPPDAQHMARAMEYVLDLGGLARCRVFTHIWLALSGLWPWRDVPVLPPEMMFLPAWFPLNIYDFAAWARQTIVPLTIVSAHRPVRPLGIDVPELAVASPGVRPVAESGLPGLYVRLDRILHRYERRPLPVLRNAALRRAERWILERQEADGSWGGIQPPWVYSLIALHLLGYPTDRGPVATGLSGLDGFTLGDSRHRRLEACQSPVWDTALAVVALRGAGLTADHPVLVRAADWLLGQEIRQRGDWAVRRRRLAPGGWAFEFANKNYPDIDDTAEVVLALRLVDHPDLARRDAAIRRGTAWATGMESRTGGWGAFDADNTARLPAALPFCDFGEVTDPPSADVTAHMVDMLAALGRGNEEPCRRAIRWLLAEQEADGPWFGRWGANYLYGTGAVVPALVAAGVGRDHPSIRRAVDWLVRRQNADGGWGEDLRSYRDPQWRGRGTSTASQTAWALLALLAARGPGSAIRRGIGWLATTQRPDGDWDEPQFTGTGFPGDFYINYHLYRLVFPLMAIGRYLKDTNRDSDHERAVA